MKATKLIYLAAFLSLSSLSAQTTISNVNLSADGSNIDNSGTMEWAYYFETDKTGDTNQTVNGVTFTPFEEAEHDTNANLEVWHGKNPSFERMRNNSDPLTNMGITNASLAVVMDQSWETFGPGFGRDGRITLKGLTINQDYRLQLLAARDPGVDPTYGWEVIADGQTLAVSMAGGTPGILTTIDFTAAATTLDVDFNTTTARGYLNAATLSAIPEPSTYALFAGILAGALILVRLRRR